MEEKRNSTLKDVALLAGVSLGTASKVANGIYVRPEFRIKVEAAMEELQYVPNTIARSLKMKATKTIGIIVPDISRTVASKIVQGVDAVGQQAGYSTMICSTQIQEKNELSAIKTFAEKMVDGIVYTGNTVSPKVARALKQLGVPVVLVSTYYNDRYFSTVQIDNEKAAYEAVKLLLKHEHREIAMLAGEKDDQNAGEPRLRGYFRALQEYGIKINDSLVKYGHYRALDGYKNMSQLLDEQVDFSAVFCASDDMAFGALKSIAERGLKVPEDISIIGFDGIDMIDYTYPCLGSVYQPLYDFGAEAAKIIISQVEEKRAGTHLILEYKVKANGSVLQKQ